MKKKVFCGILLVALLVMSASATYEAEKSVSGGWSESEGYYVNNFSEEMGSADLLASTRGTPAALPDSHTGERLTRIWNSGGDAEYAAHGETVWYYKYHYTNAQMESTSGEVLTTSGRQWDWNATQATSPYYRKGLFENTEAKTYWGS